MNGSPLPRFPPTLPLVKDPGLLEFSQIVLGAQVGRNNIKVQSGSKSDLAVAPPLQSCSVPRNPGDGGGGRGGGGGGGQQPGIGVGTGIRAWVLVWSNSLNTKINRQRGYLDMFPNSCSSLNPQSLKRHTPRNQASVLPWQLAQIPLDRPCQRNPPQLWHPFLQPKGQHRPR